MQTMYKQSLGLQQQKHSPEILFSCKTESVNFIYFKFIREMFFAFNLSITLLNFVVAQWLAVFEEERNAFALQVFLKAADVLVSKCSELFLFCCHSENRV